jgi:hypothetical protein
LCNFSKKYVRSTFYENIDSIICLKKYLIVMRWGGWKIKNIIFRWSLVGWKFQSLFGWLVADGWCWFVLREEYCWLVAGGWFVVREKYCWLMADKPSEQGAGVLCHTRV